MDDIFVESDPAVKPENEHPVKSVIANRETNTVCDTSVKDYCYVTTFREWSYATVGVICEALASMDCIWTVESNIISVESEMCPFAIIEFICGIDGRIEYCTKKVKKGNDWSGVVCF